MLVLWFNQTCSEGMPGEVWQANLTNEGEIYHNTSYGIYSYSNNESGDGPAAAGDHGLHSGCYGDDYSDNRELDGWNTADGIYRGFHNSPRYPSDSGDLIFGVGAGASRQR